MCSPGIFADPFIQKIPAFFHKQDAFVPFHPCSPGRQWQPFAGNRCTADRMLEQFHDHIVDIRAAGQISQTPSCHSAAFGKAVYNDSALEQFRNRGQTNGFISRIDDFFIDLIREKYDPGMFLEKTGERLAVFWREHFPGGIIGKIDDEQPGFFRDCRLQCF